MAAFSEPELRELQRKIADLGVDEHVEIYKLIPDALLTSNQNGSFCDLTKLDGDVLAGVRDFVNFSTDNNIRLTQYDRQLHSTTMMMQRHRSNDIPTSLPGFVKESPVKSEAMASQLAKQTPKMAFVKRSADIADRVIPAHVLTREPVRQPPPR
jgi:hypothetical protein